MVKAIPCACFSLQGEDGLHPLRAGLDPISESAVKFHNARRGLLHGYLLRFGILHDLDQNTLDRYPACVKGRDYAAGLLALGPRNEALSDSRTRFPTRRKSAENAEWSGRVKIREDVSLVFSWSQRPRT